MFSDVSRDFRQFVDDHLGHSGIVIFAECFSFLLHGLRLSLALLLHSVGLCLAACFDTFGLLQHRVLLSLGFCSDCFGLLLSLVALSLSFAFALLEIGLGVFLHLEFLGFGLNLHRIAVGIGLLVHLGQ